MVGVFMIGLVRWCLLRSMGDIHMEIGPALLLSRALALYIHEIMPALLLSRALALYIHEIAPALLLSRALEMYVNVIGLAVVVQGRELYIMVEFYGEIGLVEDGDLRSVPIQLPLLPPPDRRDASLEAGDWLVQLEPLVGDLSKHAASS